MPDITLITVYESFILVDKSFKIIFTTENTYVTTWIYLDLNYSIAYIVNTTRPSIQSTKILVGKFTHICLYKLYVVTISLYFNSKADSSSGGPLHKKDFRTSENKNNQ